jgi:hypothetical protein
MKEQRKYKNKKGLYFSIEITSAIAPAKANYFAYVARSKSKNFSMTRDFLIFILKKTAETEKLSDLFLLEDPLKSLFALLEETTEDGTPLYFPDFSKGWSII